MTFLELILREGKQGEERVLEVVGESGLFGDYLGSLHDFVAAGIVQGCTIDLFEIALVVHLLIVVRGVFFGVEVAVRQLQRSIT